MEHRNLIGQDTPAQEPVIRVTENRGGRLHHAAIIDDKLIRLIRLVGQVAVDPINGVMLPIRRRFVDVQQELQVAVLIDFDIRHLRTSGRQPRCQVKGRHCHAAPALRTGHGNTDIPGVPAVRNNLIRLRCLLTLSNIESIKAAVLSHGGKTDYLNFIDDSNNVIRSTVGYETDNNASPFSLYGKVPVSFTAKASTTQYLTGGKILIGNYAYTLGPALSASKAYSAGHGFSGTVDVKDLMGTKIGSATSHLGSLSGDWSKITPYGGEFFPVVAKATPIAGKQVYMLGATSGETVGKITRTGVSVQFPPYVTLTDMCEGNYECNPGDSGAGLFDSGAKDVLTASSNAKTYGIQSSGKFNEKGEWIGPSYFTPISNVS